MGAITMARRCSEAAEGQEDHEVWSSSHVRAFAADVRPALRGGGNGG